MYDVHWFEDQGDGLDLALWIHMAIKLKANKAPYWFIPNFQRDNWTQHLSSIHQNQL
jgi:hypothetical protein